MNGRRRVAVVTGAAGGIGAAIAEELGRAGWFVVTVDPMVSVDGASRLPEPPEPTAARIEAAGGSARPSSASVTDPEALDALFGQLAAEHGGIDAVVNAAGITRQTGFARGSAEDWLALLEVHLGGYLNVLRAALPLMAEAGDGHVVGVTSGSGWRAADAGAYACAKRAVAALTWQLGPCAPPGVRVNALSPIAATRMIAAALSRAAPTSGAASRGGLSLQAMPDPAELGPLGAALAGDGFGWCNGQIVFANGSEVALVERPRLLEAVRTAGVASPAALLESVVPSSFAAAEAAQASTGAANPRFARLFSEPAPPPGPGRARSCAIVSDRPDVARVLASALEARSVACRSIAPPGGFDGAARALGAAEDRSGPLDSVIVALAGPRPSGAGGWQGVLDEHRGAVEGVHADAAWARAAADHATSRGRELRLVTVADAATSGGRSRAQAAAQLARAAAGATGGRVAAFSVAMESATERCAQAAADLAAHLACHPDGAALGGAELVAGDGWVGVRSHPRPYAGVVYGGPEVPTWLDGVLREAAGT